MLRKLAAALTAIFISSAALLPAFAASVFPDVNEVNYNWAVKGIDSMVDKGFIKGYTDGTFKPERPVSKIEALVLSARVLGFAEEESAPFAALASEIYADSLKKYEISYKAEVAYLLYLNVLNVNELDQYISEINASAGLKRYEAAVLLTKVMGADKDVKTAGALSYTDAANIPASAQPYVSLVSEVGLMKAMNVENGKNDFMPLFEVNRAQIAVLLYRIMGILDMNFVFGTIVSVDDASDTIIYRTTGGSTESVFLRDEGIVFRKDGLAVSLSKITAGSIMCAVYSDVFLLRIDTISSEPDAKITGVINTVVSPSAGEGKITISGVNDETTETYPVADSAIITKEGSISALSSLKVGDHVELNIRSGRVTQIAAFNKERQIKGTIEQIVTDPDVLFTIRLSNNDLEEYAIAPVVSVKRNSQSALARDLMVGDSVDITLRYNLISTVTATSKTYTAEGTIEEITISRLKLSEIKVKSGDKTSTYSVSKDAVFNIDGKTAQMYDLRVGGTVKLSLESDTVKSISSYTPSVSNSITGVIETVNTAYGFITLSVLNPQTGETAQTQVFLKKVGVKIINGTDGKEKNTSDLKAGQQITATGIMNNGAFEAATVVIISP